MYFKMMYQQLL